MAESTGPQPVLPAGLEPRRPRKLQYSAPAEGGGVEMHGVAADDPFANVGRNDTCPCGSGRKYKRCHGDPRNAQKSRPGELSGRSLGRLDVGAEPARRPAAPRR